MAADDYAIIVGISHYSDQDLFGDPLLGPENDARNFHSWLIAPNGGAVPAMQAKCILSSNYGNPDDPLQARPMISDIDSVFDGLIVQGRSKGRLGRRLYIYLAGHGFAPNIEESALFMANAGLGRLGYHIPGRLYARWFITAAFFDEVVLLMDCCRDDYPRARMYTPPWEEIRTPRAAEVRYLYAFATEWSRKSREKLFPEGNEEQVQGLFTRSILTGLRGQARDEQARITTASLKKFVLNHLPGLLEKDERQEPKFEFNDEIVFLENLPLMRTQVRIAFQQPDKDGQVVLFGPTRQFLGQHSAQDGTWEVSLEQGMHELFSLNTCRQTFFEVLGGEILDVQF